jgi:cytochrome oxidase Cu insertion factor (SCO1/SenC/PrrC family)
MKKMIVILALMLSYSAYASLPVTKLAAIGGDFQLTDQNNQTFNLQQLRGKVVMMFFGYTSCPEVCPTELSKMVSTLRELGDDANKVQAVFVSIDPERDTVKKIHNYLQAFDSNLIGLTGSMKEVDKVASQYKVSYRAMKSMGEDYHVQHNANIFVLNGAGELDTIIPYGFPYAHVTKVVSSILNKFESKLTASAVD